MKKFLLAVAVLCIGTVAFAGVNAGGTLILCDTGLSVAASDGNTSVCAQGTVLQSCGAAVVRNDVAQSSGTAEMLRVYAAFPSASSPRVMGVTWGFVLGGSGSVSAGWNCGDFQVPDDGWPTGGTLGNSVTWNTAQTAHIFPVYVFAGYGDGTAGSICLTANPNPITGGVFGDDTVPAVLDDITGFGCFGFMQAGTLPCPFEPPVPGACCDPATGACTFILEADCHTPMTWRAGTCEPTNPCPPPPMGACCDAATGACAYVIAINCQGVWHSGVACAPVNPCPQLGACCSFVDPPVCTITMHADCLAPLVWHGELLSCDPNNCPIPVPVDHKSWGQIKNLYR